MKEFPSRSQHVKDINKAEAAVFDFLEALGYNPNSQRFKLTPKKVVESFLELTQARDFSLSSFPNTSSYSEPVLLKNIDFTSICEHHLLPFKGVAHIGYIPGEEIVGLSSIPYIVEKFSRNLHLQEPLTDEIADFMQKHVSDKGVAVAILGDHMCMQDRGVRAHGTQTVTHAFRGQLENDKEFRNWFYKNINVKN